MTYQELQHLTDGHSLPLCGKNEDGENVILERGHDGQQGFFKLTTAQHNGWTKITHIYDDGSVEGFYRK